MFTATRNRPDSCVILRACCAMLLVAAAVEAAGPVRPGAAGASARAAAGQVPPAVVETVRLANGELWTVVKRWDEGGRPSLEFRKGDLVLTPEQMRQYELEHAPPVLDEDLRQRLEQLDPQQMVPVKVWLRHRPGLRIARELRPQLDAALEPIDRELKAIHDLARPAEPLSPEQEREFMLSLAGQFDAAYTPQQRERIAALNCQCAELVRAWNRQVQQRAEQATADDRAQMTATIEALGGQVRGHVALVNIFEVVMPAGRVAELADDPRVACIFDIPPAEPALDVQAEGLGLTTGFWANGMTGSQIWGVGLLDSGIRTDHPALASVNIVTSGNVSTTDPTGHGTAVAGIIASNTPPYLGVAYGTAELYVASWASNILLNEADWLQQNAAIINLGASYGTTSGYTPLEQFFDAIADLNRSVSVVAGNFGPGTSTLRQPAGSYNAIVVGNVDDQNTVTRFDDVIYPTSSRGPLPDGRKKPDLTAPGHNTMTTSANWLTGPDFVNFGGTSAAAPHVAGAINLFAGSASLYGKAILIQAADAWSDAGTPDDTSDDGPALGSHWDPSYGWGQLDLWEAWFSMADHFGDFVGVPPSPLPRYRLYSGFMFANEKATLSWYRHVNYDGPVFPSVVYDLSDLDLYAYDASDGTLIDFSASVINNVEQISVPGDRNVILKVHLFSQDPSVNGDGYSLAVEEGFTEVDPPVIGVTGYSDTASPGRRFKINGGIGNSGGAPAFNGEMELTALPPSFALVGGDSNPFPISGPIEPGTGVGMVQGWVIQAPCMLGGFTATIEGRALSYGELSTASDTFPVEVVTPETLTSDVWVVDDTIERTWAFPVLGNEWSAVGIHPDTENFGRNRDIWADEQLCITSPYAQSEEPDQARDFVAVNGHVVGSATHYALVTGDLGGDYTVELDHAHDLIVDGAPVNDSMNAFEVIQTYEVFLTAGNHYRFRIDVTAGAIDLALFGFTPGRASGERGTADYVADENGAGGGESIHLTATASGYYYFVATNENHNGANYTVQVETTACGPGCDADVNNDCVVDLSDLSLLLAQFGGPGSADFDNSGTVDLADLALLLSEFGNDCH